MNPMNPITFTVPLSFHEPNFGDLDWDFEIPIQPGPCYISPRNLTGTKCLLMMPHGVRATIRDLYNVIRPLWDEEVRDCDCVICGLELIPQSELLELHHTDCCRVIHRLGEFPTYDLIMD